MAPTRRRANPTYSSAWRTAAPTTCFPPRRRQMKRAKLDRMPVKLILAIDDGLVVGQCAAIRCATTCCDAVRCRPLAATGIAPPTNCSHYWLEVIADHVD